MLMPRQRIPYKYESMRAREAMIRHLCRRKAGSRSPPPRRTLISCVQYMTCILTHLQETWHEPLSEASLHALEMIMIISPNLQEQMWKPDPSLQKDLHALETNLVTYP